MFLPLGALLAGDPVRAGQQSYETASTQSGEQAAGNFVKSMFQPQAPMPGAQPIPGGMMQGPMAGLQRLLGGGGQPQAPQGPPMGGAPQAPMSGPMGGAPQGAPPMAQPMPQMAQAPQPQMPPQQPQMQPQMGGGQQSPVGMMSLEQIVQGVARSNPGASPITLFKAVQALTPLMNQVALQQYRQAQLALGQERIGVQERGQDIRAQTAAGNQDLRQFAIQNSQYWAGVANGTIDPQTQPPPQPPQRGGAPPPDPKAELAAGLRGAATGSPPPNYVGGAGTPSGANMRGQGQAEPTQVTVPMRPQSGPAPQQVSQGPATPPPQQIPRSGTLPQGATPIVQTDTGRSMSPVQRTVEGIMNGTIPPDLSKIPAKQRGIIIPELEKRGFDLSKASLEYKNAQRLSTTMNSERMVRFVSATDNVKKEFNRLRELSKQMDLGKYHPINSAQLYADAKTGNPLARQYLIQVNNVKENYARLVNQGYAPTSDVWDLVNKQVGGEFGVKEMNAALDELGRSVDYQRSAVQNLAGPALPGSANPYTGQRGQPQGAQPAGGSSGFDVEAAKKAGYSQKEIDDYLAKRRAQ